MTKRPAVLAVGPNPAWQKVLKFGDLMPGKVNRAQAMWSFASGKGINFLRAAHIWDIADAELVQFADGGNGKLLLDDLAKENLQVKTFAAGSPTRCCTTCLSAADGSMTELIEPSDPPSDEAVQAALDYIKSAAAKVDGIALCGQLPGSMDADFYVKCAEFAAANGKTLLIDSWKNIQPILAASRNAVLKINADELAALTGINDITAALKMLLKDYSLACIAITDGAKAGFLADKSGAVWRLSVPFIAQENLVNPVGSGDTASAVFLSCYLNGESAERAFAYAIAAASANCLSVKCAEFDREQAMKFFEQIKIESIF